MGDSQKSAPKGATSRRGIHDEKTESPDISATVGKKSKAVNLSQLPSKQVSPKGPDDDFHRSEASLDSSQNADLTDDEPVIDNDLRESSVPPEAVITKLEPPSPPRPDPDHRNQSNNPTLVRLAAVLAFIAVAIGACYMYQPSQPSAIPAKRPSCEHFLELQSKYPNTDDMLWPTLIVSVDRAINDNPGEPGTFIFLYNSSSVGQSLLDDVTRIAIECFGSGGAIWHTSNDFETAEIAQDYGSPVDLYREKLTTQKVLVVQELDRVPPPAAQVFFTICDSIEPLVHRAVIFFTIDVSGQPRQANQSATAVAEGILKGLWRDELHPDVLDPLLVRLTENVFRID